MPDVKQVVPPCSHASWMRATTLGSAAGGWITGKVFEVDGGTVHSNWPVKMASGL